VFPRFYELWSVQWLGHLLPPVSDLLQGFMCVCTQVSCSVVSNWPLCEFCGHVYCDIWYIFLIPQFLGHQTMYKVQKYNSFNPTWEALSRSANYEIPCLLWNPKLHYRVYKTRHWSLSWTIFIHSTPFHFISARFILTVFSHLCLGLLRGLFPSGFPIKILYEFFISHSCYMIRPSQPPWLDHPNKVCV